ncbi:MAG TPA: hypothetical protein VK477_10235 [Acidobacteriota bacterium]|nr:hypothetical protein [Acidobacteriota bacterium]
MKKAVVVFCVLVASAVARESFWRSLTPEQRAKAGLENLTEEQRAALDALAAEYVTQETDHVVTYARQKAIAEVKEVAKAEAKAEIEAEKKASVGLAPKPSATEADAIRSRIADTFRAWGPNTTFRLENGQVWVAERNAESRFFGARENAEVELRPSSFGTWKLFLLPEGLWVRVKRVQ